MHQPPRTRDVPVIRYFAQREVEWALSGCQQPAEDAVVNLVNVGAQWLAGNRSGMIKRWGCCHRVAADKELSLAALHRRTGFAFGGKLGYRSTHASSWLNLAAGTGNKRRRRFFAGMPRELSVVVKRWLCC